MAETTYYSALHYAKKAEKSAKEAAESAASITDSSGKIIQLGFDGSIDNNVLVFNHAPGGVDAPYALVDDYEYEIDLAYANTGSLADNVQMRIKNGSDTINFVSAVHRSSTEPATVGDMKAVMRFNSSTGYRWLFKAAFKITPAGAKVFLLYPVVYNDEDVKALQTADSQNVKLTGNQTISGEKNFNSPIYRLAPNSGGMIKGVQKNITIGTNPSTSENVYVCNADANKKDQSYINFGVNTDGSGFVNVMARSNSASDRDGKGMSITRKLDGTSNMWINTTTVTVPTPATSDNSTKAATTAWFRNNMQVVTSLPSSPTAGVFYFVKE